MEYVSKPPPGTPNLPRPLNGGLRLVKPLAGEGSGNLLFTKTPASNLLLVGGATVVSKILETILPRLGGPITVWYPGSQLVLPPIAQAGTLILREVGRLELGDQYSLNNWIELAQGQTWRTQIVSTSEAPLLPRVHAGAFLDTLYYRLNTVYIDIS